MSISIIKKGQDITLRNFRAKLDEIMVGLGWDVKDEEDVDCDLSAMLLGSNGKLESLDDLIFYNNFL